MDTTKSFWLSYDLGIKGDYTGLYTFLDAVDAKECGDSVAYFKKDYGDDFINALTRDLERYVKFANTDRIYIMYQGDDATIKGRFLFGSRKRAAWEGYAVTGQLAEEDN